MLHDIFEKRLLYDETKDQLVECKTHYSCHVVRFIKEKMRNPAIFCTCS